MFILVGFQEGQVSKVVAFYRETDLSFVSFHFWSLLHGGTSIGDDAY